MHHSMQLRNRLIIASSGIALLTAASFGVGYWSLDRAMALVLQLGGSEVLEQGSTGLARKMYPLLAGVTLAGAVTLPYLMNHWLFTPLSALAAKLRLLAAGQVVALPEAAKGNEIGGLAQSMGQLQHVLEANSRSFGRG